MRISLHLIFGFITYALLLSLSVSVGSERGRRRSRYEEKKGIIDSMSRGGSDEDLRIFNFNVNSTATRPSDVVSTALHLTLKRVSEASQLASSLSMQPGDAFETDVIRDCSQLMDDVSSLLSEAIALVAPVVTPSEKIHTIKVLLSSSIGLQTACSDGFELLPQFSSRSTHMLTVEEIVSQAISNCITLTTSLGGLIGGRTRRHLLLEELKVTSSRRKLLQSATANARVAKDGTGDYTTIQEAINKVPSKYSGRYVIYIKAGTYNEIVEVPSTLKDLTFTGDGIGKTIITGNRNVALQQYTTFRSATVAVSASGFMATGITFRNTAGAEGHQAVALRVSGDRSVFTKCSFEGYQDTLYALAGRQVYRNCDIYGTVDYIFGNAIAVFENCNLYARLPMKGQQNTYTAQGRKIRDDPSGFSFQSCNVLAGAELASMPYSVSTYLGRPWKAYSRTVFIKCNLGSVVDPAGWLSWNSSQPFQDTLYYGEYKNTGPGSAIFGRVKWRGVHSSLSDSEAAQFTEANFIA